MSLVSEISKIRQSIDNYRTLPVNILNARFFIKEQIESGFYDQIRGLSEFNHLNFTDSLYLEKTLELIKKRDFDVYLINTAQPKTKEDDMKVDELNSKRLGLLDLLICKTDYDADTLSNEVLSLRRQIDKIDEDTGEILVEDRIFEILKAVSRKYNNTDDGLIERLGIVYSRGVNKGEKYRGYFQKDLFEIFDGNPILWDKIPAFTRRLDFLLKRFIKADY